MDTQDDKGVEGAGMAIGEKATQFAGLPVIDYQPRVGLVLPTMPRRVFRSLDAEGEKFWAISLERDRLTTELAEAGTAWRTETRVCPDAAAAQVVRVGRHVPHPDRGVALAVGRGVLHLEKQQHRGPSPKAHA